VFWDGLSRFALGMRVWSRNQGTGRLRRDARALDPETGFLESGVELCCRKLWRRLLERDGLHRQKSLNRFGANSV
jgi:hypothetical protein